MITLKIWGYLGIGKRVIRVGRIVALGRHISMGRVAKSETVSVSVTPAQKERWKKWAEKKAMTMPEFVRNSVEIYITMLEKLERKA